MKYVVPYELHIQRLFAVFVAIVGVGDGVRAQVASNGTVIARISQTAFVTVVCFTHSSLHTIRRQSSPRQTNSQRIILGALLLSGGTSALCIVVAAFVSLPRSVNTKHQMCTPS